MEVVNSILNSILSRLACLLSYINLRTSFFKDRLSIKYRQRGTDATVSAGSWLVYPLAGRRADSCGLPPPVLDDHDPDYKHPSGQGRAGPRAWLLTGLFYAIGIVCLLFIFTTRAYIL